MSESRPDRKEVPPEHSPVRPVNPKVFGSASVVAAYYRGDEVYCRQCFPRSEDLDEIDPLYVLEDGDEGGGDLEFLPICIACGHEFPEYFDGGGACWEFFSHE